MILGFVLALAGIGILLTLYRIVKGPDVTDRLVGVDTANIIIIGVIVLIAHYFERPLYLDIAIVYGILSFLETVVIARFLEERV